MPSQAPARSVLFVRARLLTMVVCIAIASLPGGGPSAGKLSARVSESPGRENRADAW